MKRLFFLSLVVCTLLSLLLLYNFPESPESSIQHNSEVTVERPNQIILPNPLVWIDSLRKNQTSFLLAGNKEKVIAYSIKSGDSFNKILSKFHVDRETIRKLSIEIGKKINLTSFQVGQLISVYIGLNENKPYKLEYALSNKSFLKIDVRNLSVQIINKKVKTEIKSFHSDIYTSLANTMKVNDAPEDLADKLLSIYAWDINFLKLQKEDKISVVYEAEIIDGKVEGSGKVISACISHGNRKYYSYYFDANDAKGYYNAAGENYNRGPLVFDLISSLYQKRRFHPVKRRYRAHLGMDFMADKGTMVHALKSGKVVAAGYHRANGNYVKIAHEEIMTQYLHLSSINQNVKKGVILEQGDVIGKVGSTGLSSGPHLCLRVWHNGQQKDPLSFDFDRWPSIKEIVFNEFSQIVAEQNVLLNSENKVAG